MEKEWVVNIVDSYGESHQLNFYRNSHSSLMELITHQLMEDIGDCMGRIWCGTCAVKLISGFHQGLLIKEEIELRDNLNLDNLDKVRLSCQIKLDEDLNNTSWEILDSRKFY